MEFYLLVLLIWLVKCRSSISANNIWTVSWSIDNFWHFYNEENLLCFSGNTDSSVSVAVTCFVDCCLLLVVPVRRCRR